MNLDDAGNGVLFRPIGFVRSPFTEPVGMPIQPSGACGVRGSVEILPEFRDGLADLGGFSRIILIYLFHRSEGHTLRVVPFLDDRERGVFATRAPRRPNPIGFSVVRLVAVEGCRLAIEDVDLLDGTPVLDIKPYIPSIDAFPGETEGWLGECSDKFREARADRRFAGRSEREP
ncbi:MAG: tRNA (N6-threonylcarbamoyladenosine(37)-N6)-methyltransferase TrmO [Methanospirillum sp.]